MSIIEQNNPAGRLHAILSRAKFKVETTGGSVIAAHLWADVFDIHISDNPLPVPQLEEIISRVLQLEMLISETEGKLRSIEGLPDRYFPPFDRIRGIPRQSLASLSSDISGTIRKISESDLIVLEFCSEKLESYHVELIVDKAELKQILEDVNAFLTMSSKATLTLI